jgi:hypothetical protein
VAERLQVDLGGVPETLLWTLYHRAVEARRADAVLHDPMAVDLVERIDYPFEQRFGTGGLGQWQALRVRCFDREIRRFLAAHPDGTVVALGGDSRRSSGGSTTGRSGGWGWTFPRPLPCALGCCPTHRAGAASRARRSTSAGWTRSRHPAACS